METPERIWQLMARSLNNETNSTEEEELFAHLQENPLLLQQYELLKRAWQNEDHHYENIDDAKQHISKIIDKANTEPAGIIPIRQRRIRRNIYMTAAAAIIFGGIWLLARKVNGSSS